MYRRDFVLALTCQETGVKISFDKARKKERKKERRK